jgi:cytochrome c6
MRPSAAVCGMLVVTATLLSSWSVPLLAQDAAAIYKTRCATCHGPDGKGATAIGKSLGVPDFASPDAQKQSDEELAAIISNGKNKMPAYKKSLKAEQVKDLVAFIRTLGKK